MKNRLMRIISLAVIIGVFLTTAAWATPGNKGFLPPGLQKKDKPLPPPFQQLKSNVVEKTAGEVVMVQEIGSKTWIVIKDQASLKAFELPGDKASVQVGDRIEVEYVADKITKIKVTDDEEETATKLSFDLDVTPKTVALGNKVDFALQVMNNTNKIITQEVASGKLYDFVVSRNGREVWRWSDDYNFIQAKQQLIFNPGDGISAAVAWHPDTIGTYKVETFFYGESDKPVATQDFTVVTR